MWRRWTTELVLDLQSQALSLGCSEPGREAVFRVAHDDTPAARATALQQARANLCEQVPSLASVRRVRVQFDDQWATWLSLSGSFWMLNAGQREALVRTHLERQLSIEAEQWRVCSQVLVRGNGLVACAMTQPRWTDLNDALAVAGLRARSVRPQWAARLAGIELPGSRGLVARIDGNLLNLAVLEAGHWIRVASLLVDQHQAWSPRALGWMQTVGLAAQPGSHWFDGPAQACPSDWTALETA